MSQPQSQHDDPAKPSVLLLCSNAQQYISLAVARSLARVGIRSRTLGPRRFVPCRWSRHGAWGKTLADDAFGQESSLVMSAVHRELRRNPETLIFPVDIHANRWVIRHRSDLPSIRCIALPDAEVFELFDDKALFARWCETLGLPHPVTRAVPVGTELSSGQLPASDTGWIAKPRIGENAKGMIMSEDADQLIREVSQVRQDYLVQRYHPGEDVDVSLLAIHGQVVAWTVQERGKSGLEFVDCPPALTLARRVVEATGYHGLAHLDLRHDSRSGEILLIEVNPRCWGSLLFATWIGVNFPALAVEQAVCGRAPAPKNPTAQGSCAWVGWTARRWLYHLTHPGRLPPDIPPHLAEAFGFQLRDPGPEFIDQLKAKLPSLGR